MKVHLVYPGALEEAAERLQPEQVYLKRVYLEAEVEAMLRATVEAIASAIEPLAEIGFSKRMRLLLDLKEIDEELRDIGNRDSLRWDKAWARQGELLAAIDDCAGA